MNTHEILTQKAQLANPQVMDAMIYGSTFFASHYPTVIYKQFCILDVNEPEYESYLASYFVHSEDIIMPLHLPTDLLDPPRPIPCNALFGKYYPYGYSMHGYEYVPHISVSQFE